MNELAFPGLGHNICGTIFMGIIFSSHRAELRAIP